VADDALDHAREIRAEPGQGLSIGIPIAGITAQLQRLRARRQGGLHGPMALLAVQGQTSRFETPIEAVHETLPIPSRSREFEQGLEALDGQ
jgi:hypothetical protein